MESSTLVEPCEKTREIPSMRELFDAAFYC
jgi:hypothetical protein